MLSNSKSLGSSDKSEETTKLVENAIKMVMEKSEHQQFYDVNALRKLSDEVFYKMNTCIGTLRVIVERVAIETEKEMKKSNIIASYATTRYILEKIGFGRCSEFADFAQAKLCKIKELNDVKFEKHNFIRKIDNIDKVLESNHNDVQLEAYYINRLQKKDLGESGTHAIVVCYNQEETSSNQKFMAIVDLQNKEYEIFNYYGSLYASILKSEKLYYMRKFIEESIRPDLLKDSKFSSGILQSNYLDLEFKKYVNNKKLVNEYHAVVFNKVSKLIKDYLKIIKNKRIPLMPIPDLMKIIEGGEYDEKKISQYSVLQNNDMSANLMEDAFESILKVQLLRKILYHYKKFTLQNVIDFFDSFKDSAYKDDKVNFAYECYHVQKTIEAQLLKVNIATEICIYKEKIALSFLVVLQSASEYKKYYSWFIKFLNVTLDKTMKSYEGGCAHTLHKKTNKYTFIVKDLYGLLSGSINCSKSKKVLQTKSMTPNILPRKALDENKLTQKVDFIFSDLLKKYKFVVGKEEAKQIIFSWFSKKDIYEITLEQQKLIAKIIMNASFSANIFAFFCCNNNRTIDINKFNVELNLFNINSRVRIFNSSK